MKTNEQASDSTRKYVHVTQARASYSRTKETEKVRNDRTEGISILTNNGESKGK